MGEWSGANDSPSQREPGTEGKAGLTSSFKQDVPLSPL